MKTIKYALKSQKKNNIIFLNFLTLKPGIIKNSKFIKQKKILNSYEILHLAIMDHGPIQSKLGENARKTKEQLKMYVKPFSLLNCKQIIK